MIELIFAIVIIGILAAVAIPKLATTRDDAFNAKDCKNISTCVTELLAEYTSRQTATKNDYIACRSAEASTHNAITFTVSAHDVTVHGAPAACPHLNSTFIFGGNRVSF